VEDQPGVIVMHITTPRNGVAWLSNAMCRVPIIHNGKRDAATR